MKSVLISIQPKWCELIASGKKTVEVRKTKPKIETPFKVYIYETQGRKYPFNVKADTIAKHDDDRFLDCVRGNPPIKEDKNGTPYFSYGRMKVIGEFVCDNIAKGTSQLGSCLTMREISEYANGKEVYGWHISDLVIYDEPKELSEFYKYTEYDDSSKDIRPCRFCEHNKFDWSENCECCDIDFDGEHCFHLQLKRPPQSWCYVEKVGEG